MLANKKREQEIRKAKFQSINGRQSEETNKQTASQSSRPNGSISLIRKGNKRKIKAFQGTKVITICHQKSENKTKLGKQKKKLNERDRKVGDKQIDIGIESERNYKMPYSLFLPKTF